MSSIEKELESLGLINNETTFLYSEETRDSNQVKVYKDSNSGIIFIKNAVYDIKDYENHRGKDSTKPLCLDIGRQRSLQRRIRDTQQYYVNKAIADFGCGHGDFLKSISQSTAKCLGIELSTNERRLLNNDGILCLSNIEEIDDNSLDTIFLFHVLEHLPSQIDFLELFRRKLKNGGTLIIEVPHAKDFLLTQLKCESYKKFTLWSQHLILHTRESLHKILLATGFTDVIIRGIQRYPLSNHFNWIINSEPGGHLGRLSELDTNDLTVSYENALISIDATDTLFATARF